MPGLKCEASTIVTSAYFCNPEGEMFCQLFPLSVVSCTTPLLVPTHITPGFKVDGAIVVIARRSGGRSVCSSSCDFGFLVSASLVLASSLLADGGVACSSSGFGGSGSPGRFVRSGLIALHVAPSSVVASRNCVPS